MARRRAYDNEAGARRGIPHIQECGIDGAYLDGLVQGRLAASDAAYRLGQTAGFEGLPQGAAQESHANDRYGIEE
jgi:hypothetical protein